MCSRRRQKDIIASKTTSLHEETYERLRRTGFCADSFDSLVVKLLDMYEDKVKGEEEEGGGGG